MSEIITTEDALAFLKRFMEAVNTQDNLSTASPFYYALQEQREFYTARDSDYDDIREEREDPEDEESDLVTRYIKHYWEDVAFAFTKEGIESHLAMNRHNYGKTRIYVKHAYRNDELNQLFTSLGVLTGKPWVQH